MNILVTGGAGYIGTHTCIELIQKGYQIIVVDNFSNSKPEALMRVEKITGKDIKFYEVDLLNGVELDRIFAKENIDAVIHFAGLKAVGESVDFPLAYYRNNVTGTLNLCEVMKSHGVKKLVFSSSATVYGDPESVPISENAPLSAANPYGRTKLMIEEILGDWAQADPTLSIALLRYFNPIGAHESGLIGEDPNGIPNNLLPYISQVAIGKLKTLNVFGDDYHTIDGTGVRDYIHVVDLAKGHIKALEKVTTSEGIEAYNLGTGIGVSVLQMIHAFEKASGRSVSYRIVQRRPGDVATCFADTTKALECLQWETEKSLKEMCSDAWRFQSKNPNGYQ